MAALTASLPMYNLPEMHQANAAFWDALHQLLIEAGVADLPDALELDRVSVPDRIGADVLFSQTCGYPLEKTYRGQAIRLGTPCYGAEGCDGTTHCGLFVVPADSDVQCVAQLAGASFLINSRDSNSGMNLPRRSLADIANARPLFARVIETGSHAASLEQIARGTADGTCVDCVTYAFWRRYRPDIASNTKVIGRTLSSPSLPFITSMATPPNIVAALRNALRRMTGDARFAKICSDLLIKDIVDIPDEDYSVLLDYEREAEALGYPVLA